MGLATWAYMRGQLPKSPEVSMLFFSYKINDVLSFFFFRLDNKLSVMTDNLSSSTIFSVNLKNQDLSLGF